MTLFGGLAQILVKQHPFVIKRHFRSIDFHRILGPAMDSCILRNSPVKFYNDCGSIFWIFADKLADQISRYVLWDATMSIVMKRSITSGTRERKS